MDTHGENPRSQEPGRRHRHSPRAEYEAKKRDRGQELQRDHSNAGRCIQRRQQPNLDLVDWSNIPANWDATLRHETSGFFGNS